VLPVYVIHWNAPEWCASAVQSIQKSEPPVAVTVVDNGGAPLQVSTRVLRQPENRGYTGGANAALADWLAGGEPWAVIASHDLHVEPDTFAVMLAAATPDVGIIGPALALGSQGGRTPEGEVEWLSGTCLMIRRECAQQVGPFDEALRSYVEDVDYCFRARAAGWRLLSTEAPATGLGTSVGRSVMRRSIRSGSLYVRYKHGGGREALRELGRAGRGAVAAAINGRWSDAWSDVQGVGYGLVMCWRRPRGRGRR
jgi:GT2 family glycosyltransferase